MAKEIMTRCPMCGTINQVELSDDEVEAYDRWKNREILIQDALPNKSKEERELLKTGICSKCWKRMIG